MTASSSTSRTAYRTCPLCEAICGLELAIVDGEVTRIRGDRLDVFSHGFVCPKGSTLRQLHLDPDRLRRPLVRRNGVLVEVGWDEAFHEVERLLLPVIAEHGRDAVAAYVGNPNAHNLAGLLYLKPLLKALGSRNVYSASTVDQRPKELACAWLYGGALTVAVPDLDRTDLLVVLGANPFASNGSLATAPDWPGRIEAIRARGGRLVVVDPRRSRTAEEADVHLAIRPGTDAFLLAATITALARTGRVRTGAADAHLRGLEVVLEALAPLTPEAVAADVGVEAAAIEALADELATARTAAVYGRMGTTTAEFGTLASWLVDVLNIVTGNLDSVGGAMFPKAVAGAANTRGEPGRGRSFRSARHRSRVSGRPETMGELPVACLAEEIDTDGPGRIRALVTVAGNPVLSTPNAGRLDAALGALDAFVAVDCYLNETTRHADVVLPPPSPLEKDHFDLAFHQLAIRNTAKWSPAVLDAAPDSLAEWEVLARLALVVQGVGATADPAIVDDLVLDALLAAAVSDGHGPAHGRDPEELRAALGGRRGPARLVDLLVRLGPYGDGFGARTGHVAPGVEPLTLDVLIDHPHGVDLGPLEPRLPEVLRTESGLVELDAPGFLDDLPRLLAAVGRPRPEAVLVGRRDLRSNNSWMHNIEVLVKGRPRCTLQVHPDDAARWGVAAGALVRVSSRVGAVDVEAEVTDAVRPGVVSLPHGWGHDAEGARLGVAARHPGVNSNLLTDDAVTDAPSGNAVLNGIAVSVAALGPARDQR